MKYQIVRASLFAMALSCVGHAAQAAVLAPVAYSVTDPSKVINFESTPIPPGGVINHNLVYSGIATFGERFDGMGVGAAGSLGQFDALTGDPAAGPLTLAAPTAGKHLFLDSAGDSVKLAGLGQFGSEQVCEKPDDDLPEVCTDVPYADSIGEGAISILFDKNQSMFGFTAYDFDGYGVDGSVVGRIYLRFFGRDGSSIGDLIAIELGDLDDASKGVAFALKDGEMPIYDIAGVSLWNDDPGGLFVDNFIFDVLDDDGGTVSEPGALALAGLSLMAAGLLRRRRR